MKNLNLIAASCFLTLFVSSTLFMLNANASDKETVNSVATLREHTPINVQKEPNRIPQVVNKDIRKGRNYPMQPPIIPHTIRGYEVNLMNNKCLSCHSRHLVEKSQAPMISVTHYMDRDGNFLAEVSPRRYFCQQCHVTQADTEVLVENTFTDMHSLMSDKTATNKKQ
ncbi:MAG: nitrate reductase cytochrome c-type subunit [Colwellia sp.]